MFVSVAVYRAKNIARQADIVAALTLEVLRGSVAAYDPGMSYIYCNSCCSSGALIIIIIIIRCTQLQATQWPTGGGISTEITPTL